MNQPRFPKARIAFTLVELLVVLSIIALLAALLLPSLSRAQSTGRSAKCRNNLRQIDLGLLMYLSDYAGFPHAVTGFATDGKLRVFTNSWHAALKEYVAQDWKDALYKCPTLQRADWAGLPAYSYGYNSEGIRSNATLFYGLDGGRRESEVTVPSDMIAFADGFYRMNRNRIIVDTGDAILHLRDHASPGALKVVDASTNLALRRHAGKLNVAFCDGHMESILTRKLYLDPSDQTRRRWNVDNEPHHEFWDLP